MSTHNIYWWNVENLFDIENAPDRPEWLNKAIAKDLKGWDATMLNKKLENLNAVISKFNNNTGPDILGVCEIENKNVLDRLVVKMKATTGRNYKVLHHDTSDQRGIDIAFLYDTALYTDDNRIFSLEVMKRSATRDLFQVHLTTLTGNELVLIGNHWPSRMGGQYETEPFRIMVAETLSYWVERIHEEKPNANIILMGDFNDNPFDRSLTNYLLASPSIHKVENAKNHLFYNPMFDFLGKQIGTHVYNGEQNILDQFMVSKSLITHNNPFSFDKVDIIAYPEMIKGEYKTPIRFKLPKNKFNLNGFSDHLPIELIISES